MIRRRRSFRAVARVDLHGIGLRKGDARRLALHHAWERLVGPAVARRVRADKVVRGVLELRVADPRWARELESLLPEVVGQLAGSRPELSIRRFRVRVEGTSARPASVEVAPRAAPPVAREQGLSALPPKSRAPTSSLAPLERLRRAASRYLERGGTR